MGENSGSRVPAIVLEHREELLEEWIDQQLKSPTWRPDLMSESELREESAQFLDVFCAALQSGNLTDIEAQEWAPTREMLAALSRTRLEKGFSPSETATFVFSLKQPVFALTQRTVGPDADKLAAEAWAETVLLDKLGLFTVEVYQSAREGVIRRQQDEMLELSTPVVKLWEGILAVPLIGTLDSSRAQTVMESLLHEIAAAKAHVAIIDITGVPMVDTLVAQHLIKTVTAARLMGAECFISGVRPEIAQTVVSLGVTLADITSKSSLADALEEAFARTGCRVVERSAGN